MKSANKNSIFVISKQGEPLMPTKRYGKVRHMLKNGEAKIVKRDPFLVIQLLKDTNDFIQPLSGGMDIGETIGLSIVNGTKEVFSAELETRSKNISSKIEERTKYRRTRRSRLRHREKRFDNRGASKGTCKCCGGNVMSESKANKLNKKKAKRLGIKVSKLTQEQLVFHTICRKCASSVNNVHQLYKDVVKPYNEKRLAPSVKHKIETHFKIKDNLNLYLPMCNKDWTIEKTKFDIQKMENIDITGVAYQQGDMFGFSSVRDFVLDRDKHECQNPDCKHKSNILVIHHIKYRSQGGTDKPSNLITLCTDCHTSSNHQAGSFLWDWCNGNLPLSIKKQQKKDYSSATTMNVISSAFNHNKDISFTYGSVTKRKRQLIGLEKTHANDAYSIAISNDNFEIVENNGKKSLVLKSDLNIEKVSEPLKLKQTNGREKGRRSLKTTEFVYFIDKRDGSVKKSTELTRHNGKDKKDKDNNRKFRLIRCDKTGKITQKSKTKKYRKDGQILDNNTRFQTGRSLFSNKSIVKFHNVNGKDLIYECGGMSAKNIYYYNNGIKKTLAAKKYNARVLCNRNGIIKENIKKL